MENITQTSATLAIYSDLVKIGVPGLLGLLGGLIPFLIERHKGKTAIDIENKKFYHERVLELADCIANALWISRKVINKTEHALSKEGDDYLRDNDFDTGAAFKEMREEPYKIRDEAFEFKLLLLKAISTAGIIGKQSMINALNNYSLQFTKSINSILDETDKEKLEQDIQELTIRETKILDELLKIKSD